MNINIDKILKEKNSTQTNTLDVLFQTAHITNTLEAYGRYIEKLCGESNDVVKTNFSNLLENYITIRFLNFFVSTEACTVEELTDLNIEIEKRIKECKERTITTESLESIHGKVNNIINYRSTLEWLNVDTKYQFACNRYESACVYESSSVMDDLDMIRYTININPNAINQYAKMLSKLEMEPFNKIEQAFPSILAKNTEMILGLDVVLSGSPMRMVTSLPVVMAKRLVIEGSVKQKKAFISIIMKQIHTIRNSVKNADGRQYTILNEYLTCLNQAYDMLDCANGVSVKEHLADMQPDIVMYEDGVIEDPIGELEDLISDIIFGDDGDDISDDCLESLCTLQNKINHAFVVTESGKLATAVRKGAYKVSDAGNKLAAKAANSKADMQRTKTAIKKGIDPFTAMLNRTVNDIKAMDNKERRERIITGQFKFKLLNLLKKGILIVAGAYAAKTFLVTGSLVAALITVIGLITSVIVDKSIDDKVRKELIHELETELAVVNEKLEDSRGDEKKENKYQLIRIKKKLEADLDRVRYNLKAMNAKSPN